MSAADAEEISNPSIAEQMDKQAEMMATKQVGTSAL